MGRGIIIGLLSIALIGTGIFSYNEHNEKKALLINAENTYQRAFHNLTYQIDILHDKIGTTLAMNSQKSLSPALVEVWRTTSEAHQSVGQLPLTLMPFNKTEEFLSQIGDFSFKTAVRNLDDEPLSTKEYEHLQNLYAQAADIQKELRNVQHAVLQNNLRWMDVELALATGKEPQDNTIIDGFKTVEKTVEGYDDPELGETFLPLKQKDNNFKNIKGKEISREEALEIAKKYTNANNISNAQVTENSDGSSYSFYNVSFTDESTNTDSSIDITKKGGYPIWFISNRDVLENNINLNEATEVARKFLQENGFKNMELYESAQYDEMALLSFVAVDDGVWLYPDSIKMKVALDNGDVIGFTVESYLLSDDKRKLPTPKLTVEEASEQINKNVKIMDNKLAVITGKQGKEQLCYEFLGVLGDDTYRIFINAITGKEEEIEKLKNAEPLYEDIV